MNAPRRVRACTERLTLLVVRASSLLRMQAGSPRHNWYRNARPLWCVLFIALCSSCLSVGKTNRYTLIMQPRSLASPTAAVRVESLQPVELLDQTALLIRKSPTEIEYYRGEQWAYGIGEMIGQKLETELSSGGAGPERYVVTGRILDFQQEDSDSGADAHVSLDVTVHSTAVSQHATPDLSKRYEHRESLTETNPISLVNALSIGVERIAANLAADIDALDSQASISARDSLDSANGFSLDMNAKAAPSALNLSVKRIRTTDLLARNRLFKTAPNLAVEPYADARWATSLSELVRQKLDAAFGFDDLSKPEIAVSGNILSFNAVEKPAGVQAAVDIEITLQPKFGGALTKRYTNYATLQSSDPVELVHALSDGLDVIATAILADAANLKSASKETPTTSQKRETHRYSLSMRPSAAAIVSTPLVVTALKTPDVFATDEMLILGESATVTSYDNARWAASVSDIVREKLIAEFGQGAQGSDGYILDGSILAFHQNDRADAAVAVIKLEIECRYQAADGSASMLGFKRVYESELPLSNKDPVALAAVLSRGVETIAAQIAKDIASLDESRKTKEVAAPIDSAKKKS